MTDKTKLAWLEAALAHEKYTMERQKLLRQIWLEKRDAEQRCSELANLNAKRARRREQSEEDAGSLMRA